MKLVKINKSHCIMEIESREEIPNSFVFSIKNIPDKPIPKSLILQKKWGRRIKTFKMNWNKFLNQSCIEDIAIINKDKFNISWKS